MMGKYEALSLHLSGTAGKTTMLSFSDVESILGFDLPTSAKTYNAWWANDRTHVQAADGWLASEWRVAKVDFDKQSATFERVQKQTNIDREPTPKKAESEVANAYSFEALARRVMSSYFKVELFPRKGDLPKLFDLVSADQAIVGDAKYFSMVNGTSIPPAKFSIISEHVWLLEKSGAKTRFLVFGNDRRVPQEWLKRYGRLTQSVKFFYLGNDRKLQALN